MKFSDIPADIFTLRMIQPVSSDKHLKETPVLRIAQSTISPGEYELYTPDLILAAPVDNRQAAELDRSLSSGAAYLSRIADIDSQGGFSLEVVFFSGPVLEIGEEQDIGVDDYVLAGMRKTKGFNNRELDDRFFKDLNKEFCYKQGSDFYFFVLAGHAIDGELDEAANPNDSFEYDRGELLNESFDDELPEAHKELKASRENSFCVASKHVSFVATEKALPGGKSIYVATKLHSRKEQTDRALRLAHGRLNFVDWTNAGQVSILAKYQLAAIVGENSSYLKTWDEFGNIEGEILLREAREFGVIYYNNANENRDGTTTVSITQASPTAYSDLAASKIEGLEHVDNVPAHIEDHEMSFEEFSRSISKGPWRAPEYYRVVNYDESSRQVTLDVEHLPESGKLILSLQGDITQIRRRDSARRSILEGRSANPQLGLLLEESGEIASLRQPKKVEALNAFVRKKVFKNDPTYMQEKAIEVALNTPDIALIQGPPGTGKTTVIAAIVERLNQESTKQGNDAKGQVLLTGFQHDAVENMIDRISLNSIPVPKIGKRNGSEANDITAFERSLNKWCEEIVDGIRSQYPELDKSEQAREIEILAKQYAVAPTQALATKLMGMVADAASNFADRSIADEAGKLSRKLEVRTALTTEDGTRYMRHVRVLRTTERSFLDDGPERAYDALYELEDILEESEIDLLNKAASWTKSKGTPVFLEDLKALKESLMMRFSTPPVFKIEKANQDVIDLLARYRKESERSASSNKDKRLAALSEFVAELEGNDLTVIDAISDYSFAFAATCQQSAGQKMQSLKGISKNDETSNLVYEYVIVDEAARVSPRDLMIPMAQGKRVILVGDHRQLPHIIDEEVAAQMEEDGAEINELEWLKKSMFEYLFTERLKALERQDGITRRVTLDKQFRMHPIIGDFISRNFYERFDPDEKVSSGLPASMFDHNLPSTNNKPVAWLEVPTSLGPHSRRGTSWIRQAEIEAISRQLFEWMNSEEGMGATTGEPLTFGVISFYKAQALAIEKELKRLGADEDRVRVGTVDSFQGMEFDVVFLSMVRTVPAWYSDSIIHGHAGSEPANKNESKNEDNSHYANDQIGDGAKRQSIFSSMKNVLFSNNKDSQSSNESGEIATSLSSLGQHDDAAKEYTEEQQRYARRLFGHLCLYNRLNVSMSRQKRLLVVAGDSDLLRTGLAEKFIPGLVDFYKTCEAEGVILKCDQ